MSRSWWGKLILLLVVTVGAVIYVIPTALNLDVAKTRFFFKQKINLGLDLQGGVYMVLGVDFKKVYADVIDRLADSLGEELKEKNIGCEMKSVEKVIGGQFTDDPQIVVDCKGGADAKKQAYTLVKTDFDNLRI